MGCAATRRTPTGKMLPGSEGRTEHVGPNMWSRAVWGSVVGGQGGVTAVSSFGVGPETLPIRGFPTVTSGPVHAAPDMFPGRTTHRTGKESPCPSQRSPCPLPHTSAAPLVSALLGPPGGLIRCGHSSFATTASAASWRGVSPCVQVRTAAVSGPRSERIALPETALSPVDDPPLVGLT